ncbi:hypothetical protein E2C01_075421 [Portunus trituberculatus]|uniref:Uncharacterized protein n=1 Tax=Portunus trituberculatus TaxID=210409 RepID=A0A5B7IJ34_PORTR|nr:hypothetical protein [Portunus trituberculatus]
MNTTTFHISISSSCLSLRSLLRLLHQLKEVTRLTTSSVLLAKGTQETPGNTLESRDVEAKDPCSVYKSAVPSLLPELTQFTPSRLARPLGVKNTRIFTGEN